MYILLVFFPYTQQTYTGLNSELIIALVFDWFKLEFKIFVQIKIK